MLISQAFPSEFLKAEDLQGREACCVMDYVEMRDVGDDHKPVLYFQGHEKGLVLNITNANTISAVYGDDTEQWSGQQLVLFVERVDFKGKKVPALRVRPPRPADIDSTMRNVTPEPVRRVANGAPVPMAPARVASVADRIGDVPF